MKRLILDLIEIVPATALPGAIITLQCRNLSASIMPQVWFGDRPVFAQSASSERVLVAVPAGVSTCDVSLESHGKRSAALTLVIGDEVASGLHPVASPVVDSSGFIYTTLSGQRGESVPFSVFRITPYGQKEPYLAEIINPTGLAFGPDRQLYVSSRYTGAIYRITAEREIEKFAEGAGITTGIAFDSKGTLFAGDRSGFVYRFDESGAHSVVCELEPSISAYHLAVDDHDNLLVSGPTLSAQDSIYRVSPSGKVSDYYHGFGRPQGLAFRDGRLYVAASFRGRKGVFRIGPPDQRVEYIAAGPMLVGIAFGPSGEMILADNSSIYRLSSGQWSVAGGISEPRA